MGKKKTYVNQHSAFQLMLEKKKHLKKKSFSLLNDVWLRVLQVIKETCSNFFILYL